MEIGPKQTLEETFPPKDDFPREDRIRVHFFCSLFKEGKPPPKKKG